MEDKSITLARIAERAERWDEMSNFMKERAETGEPLSAEERDMLSAAFKNSLTERRHAVRVAVGVAMKEKEEGRMANSELALGYKSKVEQELMKICTNALALVESKLLPSAQPGEVKTFYLKMQGDYFRYNAEFATAELHKSMADSANAAYTAGMDEAGMLAPMHPVRLGLALNFSVFQHEVLGDTKAAITTARNTMMNAETDTSTSEENRKDATLTLQLLQDNLILWEG